MKTRIRCAVILIQDQDILLVKHVHPQTGFTWWVPPGGGLEEGDTNILACAAREVFEETGLHIEPGNICYIREFDDRENHWKVLELFFTGKIIGGELSIKNIPPGDLDEAYIKEVRWINRKELQRYTVFPEQIKSKQFFDDIENEYFGAKYLGKQSS